MYRVCIYIYTDIDTDIANISWTCRNYLVWQVVGMASDCGTCGCFGLCIGFYESSTSVRCRVRVRASHYVLLSLLRLGMV